MGLGCITCLRLNMSNCRVKLAARSAAKETACMEVVIAGERSLPRHQQPGMASWMIVIRMLLKSCATPAASCPTDSIFLRLPQLVLQTRLLGHVLHVTMNHLAGHASDKMTTTISGVPGRVSSCSRFWAGRQAGSVSMKPPSPAAGSRLGCGCPSADAIFSAASLKYLSSPSL